MLDTVRTVGSKARPDKRGSKRDMRSHIISLVATGDRVPCNEPHTLLQAIAAGHGHGLAVGCRNGGCGVCKVQILEGHYHRRPMSRVHISPEEERAGFALACCVVPASDLRVKVTRQASAQSLSGTTTRSDKDRRTAGPVH
jgi:ferredoxin